MARGRTRAIELVSHTVMATLLFFDCMSNSRYRDKDCKVDITFILSIPRGKFCTRAVYLRSPVSLPL